MTLSIYEEVAPGVRSARHLHDFARGVERVVEPERVYTLEEARVLVERWRQEYERVWPHSSLEYRLPAPETWTVDQVTPSVEC